MFYFLEFVFSLIIFAGMVFLFRKKLKRSRKFVTGLSVALLIISFCSGILLYAIPMPTETFHIEATGDKNPKSNGNTVGIKSIVADGREYLNEAPSKGKWFYSKDDGGYLWLDESDKRWTKSITQEITMEVPIGSGRRLVFLSGNSYGIVRISYDGVSETRDLYQKNAGKISVVLPDSDETYCNTVKLCRLAGYNLMVLAIFALVVWFVQSIDRESLNKLIYGLLSLVAALTFFLNVKSTTRTGRNVLDLFYDFNRSFSGNFVLGIILVPMLYKTFLYCGEIYRSKFSSVKDTLCITLPAGLFSIFMVLGDAFINGNNTLKPIFANELQLLKSLFAVSGYFAVFFFGITWVFNYLDCLDIYKITTKKYPKPVQIYLGWLRTKPFVTSFVTLFVGYVPILILSYPGVLMGDTRNYILQIYGAIEFSNVHPVVNTWFLGLCLKIGNVLFHSSNVGIFINVLFQFLFSIIVVSMVIRLLVEIKISNKIIVLLIAYYLIHPRIQNYFMVVTKDIINAVFFLIFMVSLYMLLAMKQSAFIYAILGISDLGALLFRNDSFYVIVLSLLILFFLMRDFRKQCAVILACTIIFMGLWKSVMLPAFGVLGSGSSDAAQGDVFTAFKFIEAMQTARYLRDAGNEVTEEEKKIISAYLQYDHVVEAYKPHDKADDVTKLINYSTITQNDVNEYHRIWLQMFLKHPEIYIEGMLNFKYRYLYPYSFRSINTYNYIYGGEIMTKINKKNFEGMADKLFYPKKIIGRNRYESLRESFFSIPFFNILFTSGSFYWILLIWLSYVIHKKSIIAVSIMTPLLGLIVPLVLGPTNGQYFRYTYPYAYCLLPVIVLGLHCIKKQELGEPPIASN